MSKVPKRVLLVAPPRHVEERGQGVWEGSRGEPQGQDHGAGAPRAPSLHFIPGVLKGFFPLPLFWHLNQEVSGAARLPGITCTAPSNSRPFTLVSHQAFPNGKVLQFLPQQLHTAASSKITPWDGQLCSAEGTWGVPPIPSPPRPWISITGVPSWVGVPGVPSITLLSMPSSLHFFNKSSLCILVETAQR